MSRVYPLMSAVTDFTAGPPNLPGASSVGLLPTGTGNARPALEAWSTSRGRQYELDVVQAGTADLDVVDAPEWLNPVNTGSPWNSGANSLLPYRCTQLAAWWNPATLDTSGNMLNSANFPPGMSIAQAYDPSFETSFAAVSTLAGTPAMVLSGVHFFRGAKSLAVTPGAVGDTIGVRFWTVPGVQYTLSTYVWVPAGCTVTAAFANFPGALGSTIASQTSGSTGAWIRLTMTGTPADAVSTLTIRFASGTPAQFWVDAIQLELGAAASTWVATGPTYYEIFTGYVERYPQQWDSQGFRGMKPLQCVDALAPLSRTIIRQSYKSTVLADGPSVFIPYDDESFPQTIQRPTGGQPPIPYQQLGSQSPSLAFGGDSFLDGSKALSMSQQNSDPVTLQTDTTLNTYIGTRQGPLNMLTSGFTLECWVKFSQGQIYFGAASMDFGESTIGKFNGPKWFLGWFSSFGRLALRYADPNGGIAFFNFNVAAPWNGFPDGQWHYLCMILTGTSNYINVIDSRYAPSTALGFTPSASVGLDNFFHEATAYFGDPISTASFANMAMYTRVLTSVQAALHYQRGIGYLGEKSGARALRLLTQWWSSSVVTDTGVTSMATDFSYDGRAMLDVLQEIADTEGGLVWIDTSGFVHQDSRETRYTAATSTTSQFTFGENSAGGELPYAELEYDYDPTYVFSEADLTAGGSGLQLPPVVNAASQTAYGQRILSKTLQMQNDWDVNQAGLFYVQRYAKPAGAAGTGVPPRIKKMTLDPAANPALFAAVLSMDIGTRVTVKRRTNALTISGDYYIEQISHDANGDASTWKVELELSPVFVSQAWVLGDAVKGVLGSTTVCVY